MTDNRDTPAPVTRGIEHIGMTVPDIAAAERVFADAFGARTLYALVDKDTPPQEPRDLMRVNGLLPGTRIVAMRMMALANGPNIELFELEQQGEGRGTAAGVNDRGLHHFSLYVDDIHAAADAFTRAGGIMTEGPVDGFAQEEGEGNQVWFGRFPWGTWVELISLPAGVETREGRKRWYPEAKTD